MPERNGLSIWDLETKTEINTIKGHRAGIDNKTLSTGLRHNIENLSLSPDGRRIIAACPIFDDQGYMEPSPVRIWDIESGGEIWRLDGALGKPVGVGFFPDGKQIFVASDDGLVRIFALESEVQIRKHNLSDKQNSDDNLSQEKGQDAIARPDIFDAAKNLDLSAIKSFIKESPNLINAKNNEGNSPLHCIFYRPYVFDGDNHVGIIDYLVTQGAHIDARNDLRQTPLLRSIVQNNAKAISFLIDRGADINTADCYGYTPLHYICRNYPSDECLGIIQRIIDKARVADGRYDTTLVGDISWKS